MDPFFIFGLPPDCTDEAVIERYHELIQQHPPDRDPEMFTLVRKAYEAMHPQRKRLETWLNLPSRDDELFGAELERWLRGHARPRLSVEALRELLRLAPLPPSNHSDKP